MEKITENTKIEVSSRVFVGILGTLISLVVAIAGVYYGLSNQISLLYQSVNTISVNQDKIVTKYEDVQKRLGIDELDIRELKTLLGVKIGDSSATLNN